jgi:hypothetical protein
MERFTPTELEPLVKPGQALIVPWRGDLKAMTEFGYSAEEIAVFEQRMYRLAAQRVLGIHSA